MSNCPICDKELSPYDKKYCSMKCGNIAKATRDRVAKQKLKFEALMNGNKQRHKKFEEKALEVNKKFCIDCGVEHDRPKTERCLDCAKKRQAEQCKTHNKIIKQNSKRKPCRGCGCKLGSDIPPKNRYCSEECKNKHHGKTTGKDEKKVNLRNNKDKKEIDPKWLTRGNVSTTGTGYTAFEGGMSL